MSYIFLYVERGIFVEGYILNSDVLCFTQDIDDEKKVLIVEKNKKFNIDADCFKFIKKCCMVYGHSYTMQRQFVIDIFNYYIKTPIIVSDYNMIIFFPTAAPNSKECIWISYNNIDRYVKEKDYTKIFFKGGKVINISTSFSTIDSQITKCIKIEKYLTTKRYENC